MFVIGNAIMFVLVVFYQYHTPQYLNVYVIPSIWGEFSCAMLSSKYARPNVQEEQLPTPVRTMPRKIRMSPTQSTDPLPSSPHSFSRDAGWFKAPHIPGSSCKVFKLFTALFCILTKATLFNRKRANKNKTVLKNNHAGMFI